MVVTSEAEQGKPLSGVELESKKMIAMQYTTINMLDYTQYMVGAMALIGEPELDKVSRQLRQFYSDFRALAPGFQQIATLYMEAASIHTFPILTATTVGGNGIAEMFPDRNVKILSSTVKDSAITGFYNEGSMVRFTDQPTLLTSLLKQAEAGDRARKLASQLRATIQKWSASKLPNIGFHLDSSLGLTSIGKLLDPSDENRGASTIADLVETISIPEWEKNGYANRMLETILEDKDLYDGTTQLTPDPQDRQRLKDVYERNLNLLIQLLDESTPGALGSMYSILEAALNTGYEINGKEPLKTIERRRSGQTTIRPANPEQTIALFLNWTLRAAREIHFGYSAEAQQIEHDLHNSSVYLWGSVAERLNQRYLDNKQVPPYIGVANLIMKPQLTTEILSIADNNGGNYRISDLMENIHRRHSQSVAAGMMLETNFHAIVGGDLLKTLAAIGINTPKTIDVVEGLVGNAISSLNIYNSELTEAGVLLVEAKPKVQGDVYDLVFRFVGHEFTIAVKLAGKKQSKALILEGSMDESGDSPVILMQNYINGGAETLTSQDHPALSMLVNNMLAIYNEKRAPQEASVPTEVEEQVATPRLSRRDARKLAHQERLARERELAELEAQENSAEQASAETIEAAELSEPLGNEADARLLTEEFYPAERSTAFGVGLISTATQKIDHFEMVNPDDMASQLGLSVEETVEVIAGQQEVINSLMPRIQKKVQYLLREFMLHGNNYKPLKFFREHRHYLEDKLDIDAAKFRISDNDRVRIFLSQIGGYYFVTHIEDARDNETYRRK
jgi:hypothetical protein